MKTVQNSLQNFKSSLTIIFSLIFFFFFSAFMSSAKTKDIDKDLIYVADIISLQGEGLRIKRANSPHWIAGRIHMADYKLDLLETDNQTTACIEFHNGSQIGLDKNTKIEIVSSTGVADLTNRSLVDKIVINSGNIWAKIKGSDKTPFNIETGKGTLGVKGTEFIIEYNPDEDMEDISILSGTVEYLSREGEEFTLHEGDVLSKRRGERFRVLRRNPQEIRNNLLQRFPNLPPQKQRFIGVFALREIRQRGININRLTQRIERIQRYLAQAAEMELTENEESNNELSSLEPSRSRRPTIRGRRRDDRNLQTRRPRVQNLRISHNSEGSYYPKFTWDPVDGAESYKILVVQEGDIWQKIKTGSIEDIAFYMFEETKENYLEYPQEARPLKPEETYYWTVFAQKGGKPAALPGKISQFTTNTYDNMGIKGLYPCGDIYTWDEKPVFNWTPFRDASGYQLTVYKSDNLNQPVFSKSNDVSFLILSPAEELFEKNVEYVWKVTPTNGQEIPQVLNRFVIK